jgi:hypothetical protein
LIIRLTHARWIIFSSALGAAGILAWFVWGRHDPAGLTGGSTLGLWYGVIGSVCMVFAGVLPLLRRRWALTARWVPPREWWLQGHIWLGLLSVLFVLLHCGCRFDGTLALMLSVVFFSVIVSGMLGLVVQSIVPHRQTLLAEHEVALGQLPAICQAWRQECAELVDQMCGPRALVAPAAGKAPQAKSQGRQARLRQFHESHLVPFLQEDVPRYSKLNRLESCRREFAALRAAESWLPNETAVALDRLERICDLRRELADQQRRYFWLHAWLPVHIALSVALLVLGLAHIMTALLY